MIKALLKKQMMESFSWIFFNRKNGKRRNVKGIVLYSIIYLVIFGLMGVIFYGMADMLATPLIPMNLGWLYFALVGMVGIVLGVFGSVFNTYASLYQAKDNDLLLSMPISPSKILLMRLSGVYAMGLLYELLVMIPALIVWFMKGNVSPLGLVFSILLVFILSVFVLTLSCILGWVVALVSSKVKNKSVITVVLSLAFFALYYYVYFQAYEMLLNLLQHIEEISEKVKGVLAPFYHMGLAAEGNALSMLIFTAIIAVIFAVVYIVMKRSFLKLATTNKGTNKVKYKKTMVKAGSANGALFRKELKRFTKSASYMMNCGLGIVFMVLLSGVIVVKGGDISKMMPMISLAMGDTIMLIIVAVMCTLVAMNDITAPSVSLEGKYIWLMHVLPVTPWQALKAKLKLHLALTLPPVALMLVCVIVVFKPSIIFAILIPVTVILYAILMALIGLFMNLKSVNLNWTSETVPIKQGMSVVVALLGGWVVVIVFGGLFYLLRNMITPAVFLGIASGVMLILCIILFSWIKTKGSKKFSTL